MREGKFMYFIVLISYYFYCFFNHFVHFFDNYDLLRITSVTWAYKYTYNQI